MRPMINDVMVSFGLSNDIKTRMETLAQIKGLSSSALIRMLILEKYSEEMKAGNIPEEKVV